MERLDSNRALIDKSLTEELIIRIYPYSSSLILLIGGA